MRRPPLVAALLLAALLAPGRAGAGPDVMERLEALFAAGRAINLQLAFDRDAADDDWCMNTTVGEAHAETTPDGRRALVVTTSAWVVNGAEHAFVARVIGGALASVELQVATEGGEWRAAPAAVFAFEPAADGARPAELDEEGEATLGLRGACNRGRGRPQRAPALFALRSFRVDGAPELSY